MVTTSKATKERTRSGSPRKTRVQGAPAPSPARPPSSSLRQEVANKIVVVTGASSGIGETCAIIRRSVQNSFERFHDFERTMQLNYFGALRLIFGFAPLMLERKLDAFSWCAASEFADSQILGRVHW